MRIGVIGYGNRSSRELVEVWRGQGLPAELLEPARALELLRRGDTALNRLDLLETLDGVEPGLADVRALECRGVRVLNRPDALLAAHDKLLTARLLDRAGIPQPRTIHVVRFRLPPWDGPCVVKPRFGSWGRDVYRCETPAGLPAILDEVADRPWFRAHGAIVQELVPTRASDLRLLVAGGDVVGAGTRTAARGEWRTNVALGATVTSTEPPLAAAALGLAAVAAIGADFVGVDLLPVEGGGYVVLELNGAVDFNAVYALPGRDIHADVAAALGLESAHAVTAAAG